MNVIVNVMGDRVVLIPLKDGKIEGIYPLTAFEATMLAQTLIEKAGELDEDELQDPIA